VSYEYSSSSQNFTFPNPLREHNLFVGAAAAVAGLAGFVLLFQARAALRSGAHVEALAAAAVAFALIMVGGYLLFQVFSQLRFFFGRGRPQGLAPQLQPDQIGTSNPAEGYIKESLRQQALEYPEPGDPLSGLLYYLVPDLIYSPHPVRAFAERQFQAGILTLALLGGLIVSAILGGGDGGGRVSGWVAIILFAISAPSLLNPKAGARAELGINVLSVPAMAGLIAFSVLGPVAITLVGNALPPPPFGIGATTLVLLLVLAGVLHGLDKNIDPGPPITGEEREGHATLPFNWDDAIDAFDASAVMEHYLGTEYQDLFSAVKAQEQDEFRRRVTDVEYDAYLSSV